MNFTEAFSSRSLASIRSFPKADLHNHCLLGGKRSVIEQYLGKSLEDFKASGKGIADLNQWIGRVFRPFFSLPGAFEKAVEAAFVQARSDGVSRLEMSIDVCFGTMFHVPSDRIVAVLKHYHQAVAPEIDFRPELGFSRSVPVDTLMAAFEQFLNYHYFKSVDLYDDEFAQPVGNFKALYRFAREQGFKCKAHAGEFGSADSVREAVETLQLDAVQHGISAAASREVMKWLADNRIPLNICPASNVKLQVVKSLKVHPIRILADHGIKVSVNTDDALVFGDGVSEQFLKLHKTGVFSAAELDIIRLNGLEE
ncbi:MAG: adenosine deaminase [Bacteroidota bacterium]